VLRLAFTRVHSTTYNLMSREPDKHLSRLDGTIRLTPFRRLNEAIESWLERILGLHYLEILYERLAETTGSTEFLEQVLEAFSIRYDVGAEELSHIPPDDLQHKADSIEGVVDELRALAMARRNKALKRALGYFETHVHRMRYATLDAHSLSVGSGQVESALRRVINLRFNGCSPSRSFWLQ
jgi:hypothetical protein